MSLRPGGRQSGQYSLEAGALTDSLALAMEEEFASVYEGVKNTSLPSSARKDMRILFVAVARGVLGYLSTHESGNIIAQPHAGDSHSHQVDFAVDMG
jgi:hypothetical protein